MNRGMICVAAAISSLQLVLPAPASAQSQEELELRPVLLVIDVQNIWLPRMAAADRDTAPAKVNEAIALFRESGEPVIAVYHSDPERGPEPGSEPFRFPDWVAVTPDDPVIVKAHPSAFTHTDLDSLLAGSDRNAVFVCGLSAAGCALATYFGALDRDYMAFMIEDGLLSHNSAYTDVIEDICYTVSTEDLAAEFRGRQ
jgi:nicotinamidase-related amidase